MIAQNEGLIGVQPDCIDQVRVEAADLTEHGVDARSAQQ